MYDAIDIAVDVGASWIKAIARGSKRPYFLGMSPYCAKADRETCDQLTRLWGDNVSLESGWVSDIDGYYLLGKGAQSYNGSSLGNGERKNAKALYQILGVLGAFAKQFGLPKHSSIRLSVLLPISEYATSERLIGDIKQAIKDFKYCGISYDFKLAGLSIKPEGAGAILRGLPKGTPINGRIGSFMGGYRNVSRIVMDAGKPDIPSSKTCDLGFSWLVEKVMNATGHSKTDWVLKQLIQGFNGESCDWEVLDAGKRLLPTYWAQVQDWVESLEPVDYMVVCGGTMFLLRDLVEEKMPSLLWPDAVHSEIKRYEGNPSMAFRYIDPYCVWKAMEVKV
jgi:hypothetical protein